MSETRSESQFLTERSILAKTKSVDQSMWQKDQQAETMSEPTSESPTSAKTCSLGQNLCQKKTLAKLGQYIGQSLCQKGHFWAETISVGESW